MKPRGAYGYGALIVGGLTILVSLFLPFQQSPLYDAIQNNYLMNSGGGFFLLMLSGAILATGIGTYHRGDTAWVPTIFSLVATVVIIWVAPTGVAELSIPLTLPACLT